ncbi:MAG: M23 family metallopeptidase [Chitinophagales bacterium]
MKAKRDNTLKNKFRFVVLNDETFEEKFSLTLTRMNVWVFLSTLVVVLVLLTASAIIYTPLKYFIPGFGDYNYRSQIVALTFKTDSLTEALSERELWLSNINQVITGNIDSAASAKTAMAVKPAVVKDKSVAGPSDDEVKLRKDIEQEESFSLNYKNKNENAQINLNQFHFFPPAEGFVTDDFNPSKDHFGVDIAAPRESSVKAALDGTVVNAGWSLETGFTIALQHKDNLVTVYKHNSRIFKNIGATVKAGEVIANVGNTGELSSGPHLHFELWHNGTALNPKDYIVFRN